MCVSEWSKVIIVSFIVLIQTIQGPILGTPVLIGTILGHLVQVLYWGKGYPHAISFRCVWNIIPRGKTHLLIVDCTMHRVVVEQPKELASNIIYSPPLL